MTTEPSSDFELEIGPVWDPLRDDPRFEKKRRLARAERNQIVRLLYGQ